VIPLWKDANGNWQDLVPSSTPAKTSATQPTWPAWSTSHAPASWPSVVEANGQFIWVNRGPATDFAWHGNCNIAAADTGVISASGYGQLPYRAGVSGSSAPAFSSTTNALTSEGASLVWYCDGQKSAITTFDFSLRNFRVDVAYTQPGAGSTRAKTVDEITLATTQNFGLIQVRYGLINGVSTVTDGGEIQFYECWLDAVAG